MTTLLFSSVSVGCVNPDLMALFGLALSERLVVCINNGFQTFPEPTECLVLPIQLASALKILPKIVDVASCLMTPKAHMVAGRLKPLKMTAEFVDSLSTR